jgi:hypothetical protein
MVKQLCVLAVLASMTDGCGGGGSAGLQGSWAFASPGGATGAGLYLESDDTYELAVVAVTSSGQNSETGNAQVEKGTFATAGSLITFTPRQSSCPGPDPVRADTYSFAGQDLILSGPGGILSFVPNNGPPTGSVGVTFGCFSAAGVFTPEGLAPVAN